MKSVMNMLFAGPMLSTRWEILFRKKHMRFVKERMPFFFSAVGDPKFDNDPTAKVRPEQGLLAMRKKLGLFANIRPVQTF